MPRKHKKSKPINEKKVSDDNTETNNEKPIEETKSETKDDAARKGLFLSLDKKLKMQVKKQKKKEKKKEFEDRNKKLPEEVSVIPEIEWESTGELNEIVEECQGEVVEDKLNVLEVDVFDDGNKEMSEEEEKSLREFLRTLELVDSQSTEQKPEAQVLRSRVQIETIPEDMFEEFIENEEMVQTREAIRAFPRTSPKHSPTSKKREIAPGPIVNSPPKVFYNYYGASYIEPQQVIVEDPDDGIVVLKTFRGNEPERFFNRSLDIIVEESSDFSDASGHSDKKKDCVMLKKTNVEEAAKVVGFQGPPIVKETVKILPVNENKKGDASVDVGHGGSSCSVQPVIVETLKMSDDVVKIDLAESESEGEYEINQSGTSRGTSDIDFVQLVNDSDECGKIDLENWKNYKDAGEFSDNNTWSMKSISSTSTKVLEEETESWRSSSLNPDMCDGADADVESEVDSQRALIFGDDGLSIKLSDILDGPDKEIPIIPEIEEPKPSNRQNVLSLYEVDDKGLFQKIIFSGSEKAKLEKHPTSTPPNTVPLEGYTIPRPKPIETRVNVKSLANAMKDDMDKIIISKIRVMQHYNEPRLSETSWVNILQDTKKEMDVKNGRSGSERSTKLKPISETSSYENVPKTEKVVRVVKTEPEVPQNPEALSNLAEKRVLSLPYGKLVLKRIGLGSCCSECNKDLEEEIYIKTKPPVMQSPPGVSPVSSDMTLPSLAGSTSTKTNQPDDETESVAHSYIEFEHSNPRLGQKEKWYGMPTDVPAVLLGLSPSQKKAYEEKFKKSQPDEIEAASLLDLHQKFKERRSYHESNPWSRDRLVIFDTKPKDAVSITEIKAFENVFGKLKKSPVENKRLVVDEDKVNEIRFAKEHMQSSNKIDRMPGGEKTGLVGNEKSEKEDGLFNSKCYNEEDRKKESKGEGEKEEENEGGKRKKEESEVVGKSCLLAILQNAISDEFVPELNTDSSIGSGCERHEVSLVQNKETMMDHWQKEKNFGQTSKTEEQMKWTENEAHRSFTRFWNKEKNITNGERRKRANGQTTYRPRSICSEDETQKLVEEPRFVKVVHVPKTTTKPTEEEKEDLIITENLPAVSDVIKSFEEPKPTKKPARVVDDEVLKRTQIQIDNEKYRISKKGDIAINESSDRRKTQEKRRSMPVSILSEKELFKQKMYDEYMSKLAERIERRQQKVIRVSQSNEIECPEEVKFFDLENEFINKVKERKEKLGMIPERNNKELYESIEKKCQEFSTYWEGEISNLENGRNILEDGGDRKDGGTESSNSKRSSVQLLLDTADVENLPKHLKELLQVDGMEFPEFLDGSFYKNMPSSVVFSPTFKATAPRPGVWSPARSFSEEKTDVKEENEERKKLEDEPIPPVWTPKSAQASPVLERKEFRPVNFESPTLPRKKYIQDDKRESSVPPPWQQPGGDKPPEIAKSPSSPALSLPKAPNPTVTLLQKAREGHLPRGAHYLNSNMNDSLASDETTIERLEIVPSLKSESDRPRKTEVAPKKIVGIGPTTKEGIPLVLRSEVTEENKEKWYKRMYDSLHKAGKDDDYVTVKYRTSPSRKGLYGYQHGSSSGYQSEPESLSYDRSANTYVTLDRRRTEKSKDTDCISVTLPRSRTSPPRRYFVGYKNQPGRIEDYEPGRSSISELEANKWWDEVLEIFDRWLERNPETQHPACNKLLIDAFQWRSEEGKSRPTSARTVQSPRSFTNYASGYITDPQYVYKRTEDELQSPPSSEEQKEAYRIIQKGGEIPLKGLRKPAPERPKEILDTEIEYIPLSPTLTRIRVHKQNITPLSEFPFYLYPIAYQHTTLNYPTIPFGVCNSYSQVQIFPPPPVPSQFIQNETGPEVISSEGREQKFSVQLQNISGPEDYVQIVPKPRAQSKKAPIYVNLPVGRSCSPKSERETSPERIVPVVSPERNNREQVTRKTFTTFSDLKRIAPSINSKIGLKVSQTDKTKKKEVTVASKTTSKIKKTNGADKENTLKKKTTLKKSIASKRDERKIKPDTGKQVSKKSAKVPLSESVEREKPLSKTNKRFKTLSDNLKRKKVEVKKPKVQKETKEVNKSSESDTKGDIIQYLSQFLESELDTSYIDLKSLGEVEPQVIFEESEEDNVTMSPIYESVDREYGAKPKVESDMTGVFRSRSFSPDVKRKIFKLPDMNKPLPPKRKQSKNSPTLKMWSKMMVSYPNHRSRLDAFDSNVKFLRDRIKRKLADEKDQKPEFGDDIETVRTVKKDKNGAMSIKTNRYVRLTRPASSSSISTRSTYPDIERRRLLSEPRTKFGSVDSLKTRKCSDASTISKSVDSDGKKIPKKSLDTVLKSSTTYSVRNPSQEEDKRKSVKVTVAISSKGKDLKKTSGVTSPKKAPVSVRSSSSPCPSISSYRSGLSGKSPVSEKGSSSSHDRVQSPQTRFFSPNSSRLSSPSRSVSPGSAIVRQKIQKSSSDVRLSPKKPATPPITMTFSGSKNSLIKPETKKVATKPKEITRTPTVTKTTNRKLLTHVSSLGKTANSKEDIKKKVAKKVEPTGKYKKNGNGKTKAVQKKITVSSADKEKNEVIEGRNLVRTDSFFQNLFLRGPPDRRLAVPVERTSSVLERARWYQRKINWPETYKSEPSLSLVTFYLRQKRPVSFSKFRNLDREYGSSRSHSPLGSLHSESFQMKLRRFDSMSQFGDGLYRDFSPDGKERSSSEPPLHRSQTNSPEEKSSRVSVSEASSMRSSPNSSRSPSCRRIQSFKSYVRPIEGSREYKKYTPRARSAGEVEEIKSRSNLQYSDLGKSTSSLNLSNLSDHTEYQAYVLELMHSTRKCERFRELHKFYSNLERMGKLEKTASTGDLRPRMRNEEIIDFDRWKKIRTKERAEVELKTLVDNLVKVQKEKDLLFRAADVEAVRWKGDRGLRIKDRSVEDIKEQFSKLSQEEREEWKKDVKVSKDNYRSLWKGNSIMDVANNLNHPLISHRGRPVTLEELERIEKANARIGKEYGYSLKAWSSLSNEQINALKDQLSEIYAQDARKRGLDGSIEVLPESYEIVVPKDSGIKSPGETSLHVRCSSALSKSQTYTPTLRRKEEIRKEWKKADSISALPICKSDSVEKISLPQLPWKDEPKVSRSHSEVRSPRSDRYQITRSKSATSSKPLSEHEKKRLSMTLSREVIEKMTKAPGKGPVFPRETLGALAAAGSKLKESSSDYRPFSTLTSEGRQASEKLIEEWANEKEDTSEGKLVKASSAEVESGSGSSENSVKTVIRKNSMDVLKKVQYFEDLQQSTDSFFDSELKEEGKDEILCLPESVKETKKEVEMKSKKEKNVKSKSSKKKEEKKKLVHSSSLENLKDYFGQQKQYSTSSLQTKSTGKQDLARSLIPVSRSEEFEELRNIFEDQSWPPVRYRSASPIPFRSMPSGSSNESLFSYRSRSVSPDPTKYYRAYLRMVKCGAVRKLCNKFESWEDLLSLSSDKDFWLPPAPRRFASDPELTRDLLRRFGTDPTKVTIRGQEVGDVRWLRTKYEKDLFAPRGRSRFRRVRSPLRRSPLTVADRFMPRINVISKTAELQLQGLESGKSKNLMLPTRVSELPASPEGYRSLIDYTKDHGGYYYTGEVEKLRRKFERLQEAERLSILGQIYTSTPDVNELRDIAPYLECSWVAHRYPRVTKTSSSPELQSRRPEVQKKIQTKPRPHSSSPIRPKQPSSILKPSYPYPDRGVFADQKFDPSIHRPKYRYQPEPEVDRRYKRGDPEWWRHWNKPTVTFKESVSFKFEPDILDMSPDSPRKYVESEVTIHYKSPVRSEAKAVLSEDELARRQAESMKRIYKEERRRKYLQELQDMNSRRHTDNFIPSQKSPIPLNRYDDFPFDPSAYYTKGRDYSTDPVLVARGLYDFVGRRPRELAFRRGDIIFIIRRLDKNWCEGELNGSVGLFPLSYVEVMPYNEVNMKFGRARAKYDFVPQTSLELSAHKGDMITLIRKIDENWFEGRIGERTGIIPASYCHVLAMPQASRIPIRVEKTNKPVAAPAAHSLIHNGSGLSSKHYYAPYLSGPNSPGRSTASSVSANVHEGHHSADMLIDEALMQLDEEFDLKRSASKSSAMQPLNVRINPRPEPALYQVLFNHVPNNDDELELVQGETVTVVEKCGDGWYIGSKTSDGKLGIFPGTHVRRIAPEFV